MAEICPVCGSPHDTYGGVAMHMVKKTDEEHAQWSTKDGALEYLAAEGLIGVGSSGEGDMVDTSEPDTSEHVEADGGNPLMGDGKPDIPDPAADCCDRPQLEPAQGVYRLEDGRTIRAEGSDEFCGNCGAIVESDGTVMR